MDHVETAAPLGSASQRENGIATMSAGGQAMAADVDLTRRINEYARAVGFAAVGVARAEPFTEDRAVLRERIAAGHFSGLFWFTAERADFSSDPRNLLPTARSIISLAMSYRPEGLPNGGTAE